MMPAGPHLLGLAVTKLFGFLCLLPKAPLLTVNAHLLAGLLCQPQVGPLLLRFQLVVLFDQLVRPVADTISESIGRAH